MELDEIDRLAAEAFEGYVVRKDLATRFRGQYPVPTYVGEFLIGRYCATTNEAEIVEGLEIVERQMRQRTVRSGEQELFKSRARERMTVKLNGGVGVAEVGWLDEALAFKVLEALKAWHRRLMIDALVKNEKRVPSNPRTGKPAGYQGVLDAYEVQHGVNV